MVKRYVLVTASDVIFMFRSMYIFLHENTLCVSCFHSLYQRNWFSSSSALNMANVYYLNFLCWKE